MKKSVIALAIAGTFAVAGAAQAQTTVTPYITLDSSVGVAGSDAPRDYQFMDSNIASSVFGLRASRDLGNGLTAHAQAEGDVNTETGRHNEGAGLWRRAALVGISGDFGRVDLGTRINPFIALHGSTYAMGGNSVSTSIAAGMGYADFFRAGSITYTTPSFGGVVAQAQFTPLADEEHLFAATAVWADGPLRIGVGVDMVSETQMVTAQNVQVDPTTGAGVVDPRATERTPFAPNPHRLERTTAMIGGTYTLGDLVLSGNFVNQDIDGEDSTWFASLGAAFKVMPQLTVGGTAGTDDEGSMLVNLQARYHLHPAAHLYAMVGHSNSDEAGTSFNTLWGGGYAPETGESDTGFAVGMILSF